ncbi:MAG: GntR family transcriptional regulator [Acidobacteria bacterium]|nr:GntR family transcriptional regulator [Acidobacteriota bacterium]
MALTLPDIGSMMQAIISSMSTLKPVRSISLKDRAVASVREAIFNGDLAPGDPLRELHLAKELQISQPTVREALMELERHGLVVRRPNIETTVTNFTKQEIADRLELRLLLEKIAIRKAAQRMTEAEFTELQHRLGAIDAAIAAQDHHLLALADLDFHRYIWECSGNQALAGGLDCLCTPLFAFVSILRATASEDLSRSHPAHAELIQILRSGDGGQMEEALEKHVQDCYRGFLNSSSRDCRSHIQQLHKGKAQSTSN